MLGSRVRPHFGYGGKMMAKFAVLCVILSFFGICKGENLLEVQTRLLDTLLTKYDKRILPQHNVSDPVPLSIGIRLLNLVELFEHEEILETGVYLQQMWFDFRLMWDPSKYQRLHVIHIPVELLWQPDIVLYNNAEVNYESMNNLAMVFSNGHVYYAPKARIRTRCEVDMTRFPYDEQTCLIQFGSFSYDGDRLKLEMFPYNSTFDMSEYNMNKEWEIINTSAEILTKYYSCCTEPYQHLQCRLNMRRNSVYYTHVFVMPAVVLALLVPFTFMLPPNCNERLTLGSVLLLGIILMLSMIQEFLPEAHPSLPYLVQYYCLSMVWIALSIISSIWIINTYDRGPRKRKVPSVVRQIFLKSLKKLVCLGDDTYYPLDESETISMRGLDKTIISVDGSSKGDGSRLEKDVEEILRHVHSLVVNNTAKEARLDIRSEWHQVAIVFDRILFFVFMLTFVIYSCVLLR